MLVLANAVSFAFSLGSIILLVFNKRLDVFRSELFAALNRLGHPLVDERLLDINLVRVSFFGRSLSGLVLQTLPLNVDISVVFILSLVDAFKVSAGLELLNLFGLIDFIAGGCFFLLLLLLLVDQLDLLLPLECFLLSLLLPFAFLVLLIEDGLGHLDGVTIVDSVILHKSRDGVTTVVNLAHQNQQRNYVVEVAISGVIVPAHNWKSLFWLQHVGRGRVVQDDALIRLSSQLAHVFGKHSLDEGAVFSEQPYVTAPTRVHLVHQRICILRKRGSKDDALVVLRHDFQEILDAWPFLNVNV